MSGWMFQTKRILSTIISSLTDDLENTVQDFNDTIHKFNSSSASKTSKSEEEMSGNLPEAIDSALEKRDLLSSNIPSLTHRNLIFESSDDYSVATRQPENASPPSLKLKHSQSSPAVQMSKDPVPHHGRLDQIDFERVNSNSQPVISKSSADSLLSVSSPCLTHVKYSTQTTEKHISDNSDHRSIGPDFHSNSCDVSKPCNSSKSCKTSKPCDTYKSCDTHKSCETAKPSKISKLQEHICLCHKGDSLAKNAHRFGLKHPGKVIRAHALTLVEHNVHISQELPVETGYEASKGSNNSEHVCSNKENEKPAVGNATTRLTVGKNKYIQRCAALSPLKNMLSFALTQLEKLMLMLTEESLYGQTLTSKEVLSITETGHTVMTSDVENITSKKVVSITEQGDIVKTSYIPSGSSERDVLKSQSAEDDVDEQQIIRSPTIERTCSTDSFIIIDASSFDFSQDQYIMNQSQITEYQMQESRTQSFDDIDDEFQKDYFHSEHPRLKSNHVKGMMIQSADIFNFDFGKLISDFQEVNSVSQNSFPASKPNDDDIMSKSYVFVDNNVSNQLVTRANTNTDASCDVHDKDRECDLEDDNDSSISFIILSDCDDDEL